MLRRSSFPVFTVFVACAAAGWLAGCDEAKVVVGGDSETANADYVEGKRLLGEGKAPEALLAFTRVIHARREAPESHLEAAALCQTLKDPLQAVYHYRRFIALRPDAPQVTFVKQRIRGAEKQFLETLPFMNAADAAGDDRVADLMEKLKQLRLENDQLKARLSALPGPRPPVAVARPAPVAAEAAAAPGPAPAGEARRTYVIVPGDTLSRIAQKVYGNKNRWSEILNANPGKLQNGGARLKVGETLVIP